MTINLKENKSGIIVGLVVVLAMGLVYINRVAVKGAGLRAAETMDEIAKEQTIENWEIFCRQAMNELGRAIKEQQEALHASRVDYRVNLKKLERDKLLLGKYNEVFDDFASKVKGAGEESFSVNGKEYTQELSIKQLRAYAIAIHDQQKKVSMLEEQTTAQERGINEIEEALVFANSNMSELLQKAEMLVHEKKLAEIKSLTVEMNCAVNGLAPDAPLSKAMARINALFEGMEEHINAVDASSEVTVETAEGRGALLTMSQTLQDSRVSDRDAAIEKMIKDALGN